MENLNLFLLGIKHSLLIPTSILQILSSAELTKKTFLCILINGLLYMGSVILFNFFTKTFLNPNNDDTST